MTTDPDKFEVFMRNHQDMVFSTAVRLVGREADAEDIAQTVFLKAYEHFDELAQSPGAGAWLRTVATNLALNHLTRYRARWRFFSELRAEDSDTEFVDLQPAPDSVHADLEAADERRLLEAALQRLPALQRVPLVLFHFEDLSYEEIAARLGVSLAKVKTDIHRGREALRRVILRNYRNLAEPDADAGPGEEAPPRSHRTFQLPEAGCRLARRFATGLMEHAMPSTPSPHAL
jgi:RNA polymerase sigma-70 factor, ECF subfamily